MKWKEDDSQFMIRKLPTHTGSGMLLTLSIEMRYLERVLLLFVTKELSSSVMTRKLFKDIDPDLFVWRPDTVSGICSVCDFPDTGAAGSCDNIVSQ